MQGDSTFQLGKNNLDADKKKKKTESHVEERIKQTFNLAGSAKEQDELKRKREDFAVQLRKKNR